MLETEVARFLRKFPGGFGDAEYDRRERSYKWEAHERFVATLGLGAGPRLLRLGDTEELTRRALRVIVPRRKGQHMLLHTTELIAFRDGLKGHPAEATRYFGSFFAVLEAEGVSEAPFAQYIAALESLPADEGRANPAKWPILTVLPFLADPTRFMFLKPSVTKKVANLANSPLHYRARLNWQTYRELQEMGRTLLDRLAAFGARDLIDVQSFIWALGRYV